MSSENSQSYKVLAGIWVPDRDGWYQVFRWTECGGLTCPFSVDLTSHVPILFSVGQDFLRSR